jgi:microsomal dipeptidase-like Zn-dependent dipeptidase
MFSVLNINRRSRATRYLSVTLAATMVATGTLPSVLAPRFVYAQDVTSPPPPPAQSPIVGFIDTHFHQFANLGFGGYEVWGAPVDPTLDPTAPLETARARALPDSDYIYVAADQIDSIRGPLGVSVKDTPFASYQNYPLCPTSDPCYRVTIHGVDGGEDLLNSAISDGTHDTNGYRTSGAADPGMQWPTWNAVTTQQAYWEWLDRAHQHGLKMITMHAVNNAVLCNIGVGIAAYGCDDDSAVLRQIQGAKDLEQYIDARAGGPGQGFYRIVYSSAEARDAIAHGKLAVMLGVEVDTPNGCGSNVDCSAQVASLVQRYHDIGVRSVFPVHVVDNAFGGTGLYTSLFEFNNYLINHTFWDVTTQCSVPGDPTTLLWRDHIRDTFTDELKVALAVSVPAAVGAIATAIGLGGLLLGPAILALSPLLAPITAALPLLGVVITIAGASIGAAGLLIDVVTAMFVHFGPVGTAPEPNCNNRSLTPAGEALINALIDHKMMIEVDHSDRRTFDRILDIAEARHYPGIVAGHTGFTGATTSDPDSEKTGRHEATKTDVMVHRIVDVGGFISVIPHQGGRSRIRDLSSTYGVPFDCGNSSQTWAQIYLYATQTLGVPAIGIGSDFNGFAEWVAPRKGPNACADDHDASYAPDPNTLVKYGSLLDYYGNPLPQYTFGNRTWDYNVDGLAHVGLYPDFIADLQAQGLGDKLGPLFHSTEAYVKMWEKVDDVEAPTVHCGTVGTSWHAADVSVPCNAYDTGWGLQNPSDASFTLSTAVPSGSEIVDASTGTHPAICDAGGHCTGVIPAIGSIKIDKKAPGVAITTPAAGTPTFSLSQIVPSDYACSDGGSGVAQCSGPIANGAPLDTSVGSHTFTVHAVDGVGNTIEVGHPYNVAFRVCWLFDPSKVKNAGSTVPIKLQLCDISGANVSNSSIALQATGIARVSTTVSGVPDDSGNANPDNAFRYDASLAGYIYNLSTKGFVTGTYALSFTATGDPTIHTVQFQLR